MTEDNEQEQRDYLDAVHGQAGKPDEKHAQDVRSLTTLFAFLGVPPICVRWLERIQGYHQTTDPERCRTLPDTLAWLLQVHYETILEHEKQASSGR